MGNKIPLDEKATDFVGARLDEDYEGKLKRIFQLNPTQSKSELVQIGIDAKLRSLDPDRIDTYLDCEIPVHLRDERKELRLRGWSNEALGAEAVRSASAREGLMKRGGVVVNSTTSVCEGS